ncbi:MAG TPA: hypothetical protein VIS72_07410 [Anaerolineales bacterium]
MNTGKKIFFWGMALMLILACVPSASTPIPPLDPNAINTSIVQTAEAASMQTQAAIPPTLTVTSTPRNTFTPEPTSTLVPTVVFPTSTPIQRTQYFRVKHDHQLAMFDYKSRTADENWGGVDLFTPEVVPMFIEPVISIGTHRTTMDGPWEPFIDAMNEYDKRKLRYLKADDTALFDHKGFPYLESLTMGGNVITLLEINNGWGRVNTIDYSNPGQFKDYSYETRPDLVHKFVVVAWKKETKSTFWVNPPVGAIYWPLVTSRDGWIQMERLEPFPILPMVVTAKKSQEIMKEPSVNGEETGFEFSEGESGRIVEYHPSASNVWGRLSGGGWIALILNWKYLTDWSMATLPPPP